MTQRDVPPLPKYTKEDLRALQVLALYAETAVTPNPMARAPTPHEAKRALDWILHSACGVYDDTEIAGPDWFRTHMAGRRSAGLSIIKCIKLKPEILKDEK